MAASPPAPRGKGPRGDQVALGRAALRSQPVVLAREQLLPVDPTFEPLLPEGGLRRGTVTQVQGTGATSLALALLAGCSAAGSWLAVVGVRGLGLDAVGELGVDLGRLLLVDVAAAGPGSTDWSSVVAATLDGVEVVLVDVPRRTRAADARRLQARLRERGVALVVLGPAGAFEPDLVMTGGVPVWHGLGAGWGHLRSRCLPVEVTGRRAASRRRSALLWLPDEEGRVRLERPALTTVPTVPADLEAVGAAS